MSRPLEARLTRLEAAAGPPALHVLFLDTAEAEDAALARQFGSVDVSGRLLVVRWAESEAEAVADTARLQP